MDTKQPEALRVAAWLITAPQSTTLGDMLIAGRELRRLHAGNITLTTLAERLKQEAQIHAQEARTANATIAEIYQCVSGATGEPGNWNGAEPVRRRIAELEAAIASQAQPAAQALDALKKAGAIAVSAAKTNSRDIADWREDMDRIAAIAAQQGAKP